MAADRPVLDQAAFANVMAALADLPKEIELKVGRAAMRAAMKPMRDAVTAGAPQGRTGLLRSTIKLTTSARGGRISVRIVAGSRVKGGGGAWYAHIVERGAKPHPIRAKRGGVLRLHGGRFATAVEHPGFQGRRFMRNALYSGADSAISLFGREVDARLKRALRKYQRNLSRAR